MIFCSWYLVRVKGDDADDTAEPREESPGWMIRTLREMPVIAQTVKTV